MNMRKHIVLQLLAICVSSVLIAQDTVGTFYTTVSDLLMLQAHDKVGSYRLGRYEEWELNNAHTAFPAYKSVTTNPYDKRPIASGEKRGWFYRKMFLENFVLIDTGDFFLAINPALHAEVGMDLEDTTSEKLYVNTRGISIHGRIGKKVTFFSRFYENQSYQPQFIDDFAAEYGVIPGQGRFKDFKETGYDYAMASGVISISPNKRLNIQFGNGKLFLGDGYRSLVLSRNAFNYPHVRVTSWWGPFQLTNIVMGLQNLNVDLPTSTVTERRFQRKLGTLHHLDWAVKENFTIGIFEQMIWAASSTGGKFQMNSDVAAFLLPVPMLRPLKYGLADENNVMVGANSKLDWPKRTRFYGQFIIDDLKSNKSGFQVGVNTSIIKNFRLGLEYNQVSIYTYTHSDSTRNFTHYNQALGHPGGSGFKEINISMTYYYKNLYLLFNLADVTSEYRGGTNILKPDTLITLPSYAELPRALTYVKMEMGYTINRRTGFRMAVGLVQHWQNWVIYTQRSKHVYFSLRTNIPDRIYDF